MPPEYRVNTGLDVPIYVQLIDMIRADIMNGKLVYGDKLPTVRDFSDTYDVARGTVMRAYSELEQQGYLEKIQGRGTFVSYRANSGASRKDVAMTAIEAMLCTLDALNFTSTETEIFINLKLREHYTDRCDVSLTVVDSCAETRDAVLEQLHTVGGVEIEVCPLDEILAYPYKISSDTDLVVVPREEYDALAEVIPDGSKLARSVLALTPDTVSALARIPRGSRVAVLSRSEAFGKRLEAACRTYAPGAETASPVLFSELGEEDLIGMDALLVPENYARFCDRRIAESIAAFAGAVGTIPCRCVMDEGSFLGIRDRIDFVRENKR